MLWNSDEGSFNKWISEIEVYVFEMWVQINYESVFSFFDLFGHFIETGTLELVSGDSDLNMFTIMPDSH